MMRWVVGSSLKSKLLVLVAAAGIVFFGIWQLRSMPVDVLPEFEPPTVVVQTEALGLSAAEVEQMITVPLEQDLLNGVAFLDTIRSESVPGLSSIEMVFEPGTDLLNARQVVQERLSQAQVALPGVQSGPPQMLQPLSSTSRVMMIGLSSDEVSTIQLSILSRWVIAPRLLGVPGVANVSVWGNRERQLQVLVDPQRLAQNGLTLQEIVETTANAQFVSQLTFTEASTPGTGGILETPSQRIGIQHQVPFATPQDLAKVPIEDEEGGQFRLGDVTQVVEDHQPLIGDAVGSDLMLVIEKFPNANTLEVTRAVEGALDLLRPGLPGIEIDPTLYRPAAFIERSTDDLRTVLLIGALLAVLALGAFLFEWRTALISVVAILLSLSAAVVVLSFTKATLNSMIAAGLVLALVVLVDEAVADAENVARRLRKARREGEDLPVSKVVLENVVQMRSAAGYATVIMIVSVAPVFFTQGAFGAFFPSIATSYAAAVLASTAIALTATPVLGALLLGRVEGERRESPVARWLERRYTSVAKRFAGSPRAAFITAGIVLAVGLATLPFLDRSMIPSFKNTNLLVQMNGSPGTSLPEMHRVAGLVGDELRTVAGVKSVGTHVGRAVLSDQVVGTNSAELWVTLDPDADYDATVASIRDAVEGYPGLDRRVLTYEGERIREILPGPGDPLVVRVYGEDLGVLRSKAEEVRGVLSEVEGVVAPRIQVAPEEPTLQIEVDLAAAQREGTRPGDVRRAAATLVSGLRVGSLFEEQKVFEVVVWGTPETRGDLSSVHDLLVDTPQGGQVRLGDVADVRIIPGPTVIRHDAVSRYIDVSAGVSGRDLGSVTHDVEESLRKVSFPLEYHTEIQGDFAQRQAADRRAISLAVVAAVGIFLLLQAGLSSWRRAALAFAIMLLALTGGAVAVLIDGGTLSLGSMAGFFAILAIAARQTMLQFRHYEELEWREGVPFGPDLIVRGTRERLAPLLASACTSAAALAPLVAAGAIAGLEIVHPMAVVVLGGLAASSFLTLFVAPALYLRLGSIPETVIMPAERQVDRPRGETTLAEGRASDATP